MSSKAERKLRGAACLFRAAKAEIDKRFGKAYVGKARKRLCRKCKDGSWCFLYPITTRGEDCPYYKQKEVK